MRCNLIFKQCVFVIFMLVSSFAFADTDEQAVASAYNTWCQKVGEAQGDPAKIVPLYASGAILLPTLSPEILQNTNGGLDEYFKYFTGKKNLKCKTNQIITHVFGDVATNSGLYTFTYHDVEEGLDETAKARFSFVYKKEGNKWLIVNHHSSLLPQKGQFMRISRAKAREMITEV